MDGFKDLQKKKPIIGDVRGKGLMMGIELVKDQQAKTPAQKETKLIVERLHAAGVIVGLGGIFKNVIRVQPPLVISEEQAKTVLKKFEKEMT